MWMTSFQSFASLLEQDMYIHISKKWKIINIKYKGNFKVSLAKDPKNISENQRVESCNQLGGGGTFRAAQNGPLQEAPLWSTQILCSLNGPELEAAIQTMAICRPSAQSENNPGSFYPK